MIVDINNFKGEPHQYLMMIIGKILNCEFECEYEPDCEWSVSFIFQN